MKKFTLFLLCFSLFVLALAVASYYLSHKTIQTKTFFASANITDDVAGFDLNKTSLSFGKVKLGSSMMRNILFHNDYPFKIIALVDVEGSIKPFMIYEPLIQIDINETKSIPFTFSAGFNESLGYYSGNITLRMRIA